MSSSFIPTVDLVIPSNLPECNRTWADSLVAGISSLLITVKDQAAEIVRLTPLAEKGLALCAENQILRDAVAKSKGHCTHPKFKGGEMAKKVEKGAKSPSDTNPATPPEKRKPGGSKAGVKKAKTANLTIDFTCPITIDDLPDGAKLHGYSSFIVQELVIKTINIEYQLARYLLPDGKVITAPPPIALGGTHFGPTLQQFMLYQYHGCNVTQPKLATMLTEFGMSISEGQINKLLTLNHVEAMKEKADLLRVGLAVSTFVTTDDTGARHQGKNGYATVIGNHLFAWFGSADNKSRAGFIRHLLGGVASYIFGPIAVEYLRKYSIPSEIIDRLTATGFNGKATEWEQWLTDQVVCDTRHNKLITEAAMMEALFRSGINPLLAIISDGANQFAILQHGLCWVHAERLVHKLVPATNQQMVAQTQVRNLIWNLYYLLAEYRLNPTPERRAIAETQFDEIFDMETGWLALDSLLGRLASRKKALLLVLDRPDVPLHTNTAESNIRSYVIRRKISGGTRSDIGRDCRNAYASFAKTCYKLGQSFWQFLGDRVRHAEQILPLGTIVKEMAASLAPCT